jgi:sugar lactone lactonase YvrE
MKKTVKFIGLVLVVVFAYLLLWPVPVEPLSWNAPKNAGYVGDFSPNTKMAKIKRISLGDAAGPEDAAVGPDGMIYTSSHGGRIFVLDPANGNRKVFADTKGRTLGIEFGPNGNLYVADAFRGVLIVRKDGKVEQLTEKADDGSAFGLVDDLDVAKDGTVYFSDATTKFGARSSGGTYSSSLLDLMEHGLYGRILKYDPVKKSTTVIAKSLSFANGVALAQDESYLVVLETGTYTVYKLWLKGDKAGKLEPLIKNLPGFPDNVNTAADGTFWLGLVSPRSGALDALAGKPFVRKIVQRLPAFMRPKAQRYGFVVHIDGNGKVLETLQDPGGSFALTTGAVDGLEGKLIITSLTEPAIGILDWTETSN